MDLDSQAAAAERALEELQKAVQPGSKGSADKTVAAKQQRIASCEKLAQRVKNALDSYKLETRTLSPAEQVPHQHRIRSLEEGLKQAKTQIEWKRLDTEAAAAHPSSGGSGPQAPDVEAGPMSLQEAVESADRTQDESQASLARSMNMVLRAEEVGIATLTKMHEQEEQMARIAEDVEDVKANIARSKKLVSQIARGAARDRCIQLLCAMITIAIMVMIALAVTGNDDGALNVPEGVRQVGGD
mmetsp:Transcript_67968/g.141925  ORF Transcript_67968/g.141925 Transcript_67968/m.141925 type:complete len:243 (+) Transcript_67968:204-932(+)